MAHEPLPKQAFIQRRLAPWLLGAAMAMTGLAWPPARSAGGATAESTMNVYAFDLPSIDGGRLRLADFAGKALLIVNTASLCGYTYQYEGLQRLWSDYKDRGLVVLGVPSGDFAGEEYATNGEIRHFCTTRFDVDFPLSEKVHVRGRDADPLFAWLRATLGDGPGPMWNFHKYLIAPDGRPVASFPSAMEPGDPAIVAAIQRVLPPARSGQR